MEIGITANTVHQASIKSSDTIMIEGKQLVSIKQIQRNSLIERIKKQGFDQVIDEIAYTWFNRFIAPRFMEVNNYLPTKIRVLSSAQGEDLEPEMMKQPFALYLHIDQQYVYELKLNNDNERLFKYLIIKLCNELHYYMPFMFETIADETELLFPEGLLAPDSLIRELTNIHTIPEVDWTNVEIIGWLYQYYISEEKDRIF